MEHAGEGGAQAVDACGAQAATASNLFLYASGGAKQETLSSPS